MSGNVASPLPMGGRGGAQTLMLNNKQGGQNSVTFLAADINALLGISGQVVGTSTITGAGLVADLIAQLNANTARIQGFATGGG